MKLTWLFAFPLIFVSLVGSALAQGSPFHAESILNSLQSFTASTIPPNGDLNPYGVAFVPAGFPSGGATATGNLLVANFNNSGNLQGTGTTIISISPTGQQSLFATSSQIGLDTALGVLTQCGSGKPARNLSTATGQPDARNGSAPVLRSQR